MEKELYTRVLLKNIVLGGIKMAQVILYQMSFFGKFESVKPNSEILIELMKSLSGFLPSTQTVTNINPITNEVVNEQAIKMVDSANGFFIVVMPERIDVNYNYQVGKQVFATVEKLTEKSANIMKKTVTAFEALHLPALSYRLAVNCRVVFKTCSNEESDTHRRALVPSVAYYDRKIVPEWNVSLSGRNKVILCNEEETNEITNIMSNPLPERKSALSVMFDVNTSQFNQQERFSIDDMLKFAEYANRSIDEMQQDIGGFIK